MGSQRRKTKAFRQSQVRRLRDSARNLGPRRTIAKAPQPLFKTGNAKPGAFNAARHRRAGNMKWQGWLLIECRNRAIVPFGRMSEAARERLEELAESGRVEYLGEAGWHPIAGHPSMLPRYNPGYAFRIQPGWNPETQPLVHAHCRGFVSGKVMGG